MLARILLFFAAPVFAAGCIVGSGDEPSACENVQNEIVTSTEAACQGERAVWQGDGRCYCAGAGDLDGIGEMVF